MKKISSLIAFSGVLEELEGFKPMDKEFYERLKKELKNDI